MRPPLCLLWFIRSRQSVRVRESCSWSGEELSPLLCVLMRMAYGLCHNRAAVRASSPFIFFNRGRRCAFVTTSRSRALLFP
ncbi:hypothetical protein BJ912DRAFT_995874 [Pholiota molesta]|nr:hypothetical protein BJ912DRAFT_995874 [Pholiota molesta]